MAPLFSKPTKKDGSTAVISCAISAPLDNNRLISQDVSQQALKQLAKQGLETSQPGYVAVSDRDRTLSGQHAYEITWENIVDSQTVQRIQTLYFSTWITGIYALSLQTAPHSFRWLEPDFQHWLGSVRILVSQRFRVAPRSDAWWVMDPSNRRFKDSALRRLANRRGRRPHRWARHGWRDGQQRRIHGHRRCVHRPHLRIHPFSSEEICKAALKEVHKKGSADRQRHGRCRFTDSPRTRCSMKVRSMTG